MSDSTASLARSSAGMAAGTIASRGLGVVRAALQALAIGTAAAANGWEVANTLPNIVYLLLAGGVLNAVLVPQITRAATHADGGRDYVDRLLTLSIGGIALVTVLITAAAPLLVRLYASTLDPATLQLSITFAFICLPQIFFYGLYTVLGQVLNARGQFAAFFWAPVAANVVVHRRPRGVHRALPAQPAVADYTAPMIWLLAGSATLAIACPGPDPARAAVALGLPLPPALGLPRRRPARRLDRRPVDVRRAGRLPAGVHRHLPGPRQRGAATTRGGRRTAMPSSSSCCRTRW